MSLDQINTRKQGDVGLGRAIAYFTKQGTTVCIPLTDNQPYDLIIDDGEIKRIQVKTTKFRKPKYFNLSLTVKGGNKSSSTIKKFDHSKVEFIYILTAENTEYLIPSSVVRQHITLGPKYDQFIVE